MEMRFTASGPGDTSIAGTGIVIDISSTGLAFHTSDVPRAGMLVAAAVNWPAVIDNNCKLQLRIDGEVVRTGPQMAVVNIRRYEFRTSGRVTPVSRNEVQALRREFGDVIAGALSA